MTALAGFERSQIERPGMHRKFLPAGKEAKAVKDGLATLGVPYEARSWPDGVVEVWWPAGRDTGNVFPPTVWKVSW